ncbi:MAG: dihydrofolate synthase / folylpolyglutamate synthase, partial [Blastocatellia bacterium]|nr:dihydrofolate synthase / folylpolyglutamate synthase [Blastocatellia bacterium]
KLGLRGRHQVANVALAIAVAESLVAGGFHISDEAIVKGIETAEHPGRLEIEEGQPRILLDGAHNPAAARVLHDYLNEFIAAPLTIIFGAMRDKSLSEMLSILWPMAEQVVLTTFANARAASVDVLSQAVPAEVAPEKITYAASPTQALREALARTPPHGIICVTGSLYLIGEFKKLL